MNKIQVLALKRKITSGKHWFAYRLDIKGKKVKYSYVLFWFEGEFFRSRNISVKGYEALSHLANTVSIFDMNRMRRENELKYKTTA